MAPPASSGPTVLRPPTQKATHCWSSWRTLTLTLDRDPDGRLEKSTVPGPAIPTHRGPAQSFLEWQPGHTLAIPAGVAVGTRHGRPSKAHTH
ncbi:hypothetical protein QTO34_016982 [Cnephaeus nilssonii]|uniref:Uncharacterized protein n=1 Tax=Cnephaeus nilssonii TaxID=3371016 RepID=A0AA40LSE4_CNENI|nr:hypothetical protein QTO34_016982 [Eptesicus nilssonii]